MIDLNRDLTKDQERRLRIVLNKLIDAIIEECQRSGSAARNVAIDLIKNSAIEGGFDEKRALYSAVHKKAADDRAARIGQRLAETLIPRLVVGERDDR